MVLVGLLLTTIFGFLVTILISRSLNLLERLALAFGLGLGIQTLFMFYLALLRIPLTGFNVAFVLVISCLFLLFLTRKRLNNFSLKNIKPDIKTLLRSLSILERSFLIVILSAVLYSFIVNFYWPGMEWDAIALYDWRAKVFVDTGFMDEAIKRGYFFGYPLLTSMAHAWVYLLGGTNPKFIYPLIYLSFIIIFYFSLREFTSRPSALFLTVLMSTWPSIFSHSTVAYTNFPYTFYFATGAFLIYAWMIKQKGGYLALGSLMTGLSSWIRSQEPFWMAMLALLIIFAIRKKKPWGPFIFSLLFFPIQQSWRIYLAQMVPTGFNIVRQTAYGLGLMSQNFDPSRIFLVIGFVWEHVIVNWMPILILLFFALVLKPTNIKKHGYFLFLLGVDFALLIFSTYIFSYAYPGWDQIWDSLTRMSMFFIPLFFFAIGLLIDFNYLFKRVGKTLKNYFV